MVKSDCETLAAMLKAGQLPMHLTHIRFPHYRNLVANARLEFSFPITALVGPNGSGKSSVLQAIFGAPEGHSVGRFWFATSVDPIDDRNGRPTLIYGYRPRNDPTVREVVKTRIQKKQRGKYDPDYWEPSRPLKQHDMLPPPDGLERTPGIRREVVYLNFRHYIPAFERYYYAVVPPTGPMRDYLRNRSRELRRVIHDGVQLFRRGTPQNELPESLSQKVLAAASRILRKNYSSATWVRHRFFDRRWGHTAIFSAGPRSYSNAFAGSGEIAVLYLVRAILDAKEDTLVLLDEPEISLHPSAQGELVLFLLEQAKAKRLQIVFTTHAPGMLKGLPPQAISVFVEQAGLYEIENGVHPDVALHVLGQPTVRPKLIVEDEAAKHIVKRALKRANPRLDKTYDVEHQPGGAKDILARCVVYSEHPDMYAVVLDPDQKLSSDSWAIEPSPSASELDALIRKVIGFVPKFHVDGGVQGGNEQQAVAARIRYLNFLKKRVKYLPDLPEDILWGVAAVRHIGEVAACDGDPKKRLLQLAEKLDLGLNSLFDNLAAEWGRGQSESLRKVANTLQELAP